MSIVGGDIMLVKILSWWRYHVGGDIILVKVLSWWRYHLNTPAAFLERSDVPVNRTVTGYL